MDEAIRTEMTSHTMWLVIRTPANPNVRLDAAILDKIEPDPQGMVLDSRGTKVLLHVDSKLAIKYASELLPHTRRAPITNRSLAELARKRLASLRQGPPLHERCLFLGPHAVVFRNGQVWIGKEIVYDLDEVEDFERRGFPLLMRDGSGIQAALALLVVTITQRPENDVCLLEERLSAYDSSR